MSAVETMRATVQARKNQGKIDTSAKDWRTRLPPFPEVEFGPTDRPTWSLQTSEGALAVRLLPDVAPRHVANWLYLTELGYFDGLTFHRVITDFMAQGGCPLGTGTGGPGYTFEGECRKDVRHDRPGLLSMANTGQPKSDGSQFFLTFVATPWLDMKHTIFGELNSGQDALKALESHGSRSGEPAKRLLIESARIT